MSRFFRSSGGAGRKWPSFVNWCRADGRDAPSNETAKLFFVAVQRPFCNYPHLGSPSRLEIRHGSRSDTFGSARQFCEGKRRKVAKCLTRVEGRDERRHCDEQKEKADGSHPPRQRNQGDGSGASPQSDDVHPLVFHGRPRLISWPGGECRVPRRSCRLKEKRRRKN